MPSVIISLLITHPINSIINVAMYASHAIAIIGYVNTRLGTVYIRTMLIVNALAIIVIIIHPLISIFVQIPVVAFSWRNLLVYRYCVCFDLNA